MILRPNNPPRIDLLPEDRRGTALLELTQAARRLLEYAWNEQTAFQGIVLQPDDPPSRGQCGVSSLWFARQLQQRGVEASFVDGTIHILSGKSDDHCWVQVDYPLAEPTVIDLTSDQYPSPHKAPWSISAYDALHGDIGKYTPEQIYKPNEIPHRKLLAREALLLDNIAKQPFWRRRKFTTRP